MTKTLSVLLPLSLLSLAACTQSHRMDTLPPEPPTSLQRAAIQQALLQATSDGDETNPEPVKLEQIALDADYALATWTRGEEGGQALLRWEEGSWKVLISEPGWLGLRRLEKEGVPGLVCRSLLEQIDPNWASYEVF